MSKQLIEQYRRLAELGSNFRGLSLLQHQDTIAALIRSFPEGTIRTLLDYGSGAGDAYRDPHNVHHAWPGIKWNRITLYDPAFRGRNKLPPAGTQFDGVICSDVLEHVPEDELDELIKRLFGYARHFVFASVCCRPAKKSFEDGTNMHITLRPFEWWDEKFTLIGGAVPFVLVETP